MALCGVYVGISARSRFWDIFVGVIVGLLCVLVALVKPTFVVLLPAVLLGLLIQMRWSALCSVCLGIVIGALVIDPGFGRFQAAFAYAQASVGARPDSRISFLIVKAIRAILAQPVALTLTLWGIVTLFLAAPRRWQALLGIIIVAGGGVGMTATMGGGAVVGQLALPIMLMTLMVCAARAERDALHIHPLLTNFVIILITAFSLPHFGNLIASTLEGWQRRGDVKIVEGPFQTYLSIPARSQAKATQYDMLADGITALRGLDDLSTWGIVADNNVSFEFALTTRPVPGYPLWPRPSAPELADDIPLPVEVDLILFGRDAQIDTTIGPILRAKMGPRFALCKRSDYWDIYVRTTRRPNLCDAS